MKENVKRVFYVRHLAHPCYLDIIAQRPEIRLDKLENESADDVAQPIMAAAHAYQIGSARDELKPRFHVQRDLLARMPNLLLVSTNGAEKYRIAGESCVQSLFRQRRSVFHNGYAADAFLVDLDRVTAEFCDVAQYRDCFIRYFWADAVAGGD